MNTVTMNQNDSKLSQEIEMIQATRGQKYGVAKPALLRAAAVLFVASVALMGCPNAPVAPPAGPEAPAPEQPTTTTLTVTNATATKIDYIYLVASSGVGVSYTVTTAELLAGESYLITNITNDFYDLYAWDPVNLVYWTENGVLFEGQPIEWTLANNKQDYLTKSKSNNSDLSEPVFVDPSMSFGE